METIAISTEIFNAKSHYDYSKLWDLLEAKGKQVYGKKFCFHQQDADIILRLLIWFMQDIDLASEYNINLSKGILLSGPVGCGKTSLMNLMRFLLHPAFSHRMKSCREVAFEYANEGYPIIRRYTKKCFQFDSPLPISICFDDLGLETEMQYFGNSCNTMAEVLLSRYDYFISHKMFTHITTNLNSKEIEERYGKRVRSRLREMFNLISFNSDVKDKRS
jgi:hypothetical protein